MDVGDDIHAKSPTVLPYDTELASVDLDNAVAKACLVNVIVEQELQNPSRPRSLATEEERTTFPGAAIGAAPQFDCAAAPDASITDKPRSLPERGAHER